MAGAISSFETLGYVKETVWGTTPTTPTGQSVRASGIRSRNTKTAIDSGEIVTTRDVQDSILVGQRGGLDFDFEVSFGLLDDFLESLMGNAWSSNVLTVNRAVKSFSIERFFADIAQSVAYTGAVVDMLSLNIPIGRPMTGTCGMLSKKPASSALSIFSSRAAANTNPIMEPIDHLQLVQEGGSGSIAGISEITMNLKSNLVDQAQIGSVDPLAILPAQFTADGTFSCYFQDATYLAKHLSHATTSLSFTIGGASSLKYNFLFNKVKLTIPDIPNSGPNQPLITQVQWKAIFSDSANTTLKITRTP